MQETSLPQDWLESASLWKTLSPSEREKLLQRCTVSHYQAGQQVISEADSDNRVMFIVQGSVHAGGNSASGKEFFTPNTIPTRLLVTFLRLMVCPVPLRFTPSLMAL